MTADGAVRRAPARSDLEARRQPRRLRAARAGADASTRARLRRRRGVGRDHPRRERRGVAAVPVPCRVCCGRQRRRSVPAGSSGARRACRSGSPRWPQVMALHPDAELRRCPGAAAAGIAVLPLDARRPFRWRRSRARRRRRRPRWFQLYVAAQPRSTAGSLVERAAASGYRAIVLTVDLPVLGFRERDRGDLASRSAGNLPHMDDATGDPNRYGALELPRASPGTRSPRSGRGPRCRWCSRASWSPATRGSRSRPASPGSSSRTTAGASSIGSVTSAIDTLAEIVEAVDHGARSGWMAASGAASTSSWRSRSAHRRSSSGGRPLLGARGGRPRGRGARGLRSSAASSSCALVAARLHARSPRSGRSCLPEMRSRPALGLDGAAGRSGADRGRRRRSPPTEATARHADLAGQIEAANTGSTTSRTRRADRRRVRPALPRARRARGRASRRS